MEVDNSDSNIALLTPEEHAKVHYLAYLCAANDELKSRLKIAMCFMNALEPYGGTTWNKGKRYKCKAISNAKKGKPAWNKGKQGKPWTDEQRARISAAVHGTNNPMYGKPCYYNMSDSERAEWAKHISDANKGKPKSDETKQLMSQAAKLCQKGKLNGAAKAKYARVTFNCSWKELSDEQRNQYISEALNG